MDAHARDGLLGLELHEGGQDLKISLRHALARQAAAALHFDCRLHLATCTHVLLLCHVRPREADAAVERLAAHLSLVRRAARAGTGCVICPESLQARAPAVEHGGEALPAARRQLLHEVVDLRLWHLHRDRLPLALVPRRAVALVAALHCNRLSSVLRRLSPDIRQGDADRGFPGAVRIQRLRHYGCKGSRAQVRLTLLQRGRCRLGG
mmetsp:Transcript_104243/g.222851  ORF Transcript_104243/g.222851 Transcript_104243/m.222851 type:complete len:208 (-) Transcript_104243:139-762(-)